MTFASPSGLSVKMFRQVEEGRAEVETRWGVFSVQEGDWIEVSLFPFLPPNIMRRLGTARPQSYIERQFQVQIADLQLSFRPPATSARIDPMPPLEESEIPVLRPGPDFSWADLPPGPLLLLDPEVQCPRGEASLAKRMAPGLRQAEVVFGVSNASEPCSLPIANEASPELRIPPGTSIWEAYDALSPGLLPGAPFRPGAALLSAAAVERVRSGERLPLAGVISRSAYHYRERDVSSRVADAFLDRAVATDWPPVAELCRQEIRRAKKSGPVIAFFSTAIGAWGGVAVLLRLVDELQARGIRAVLLYQATATEWTFPVRTAPVKVRNGLSAARDWMRLIGSGEGVLVPSNWGAGSAVKTIAEHNPGMKVTTFLQDREDFFEKNDGTPVGMKGKEPYLAIGRGVAVANWILDSAERDLGLDRACYRVIPPGIDTKVFRPVERPENTRVRILAMWRPQTNIRRGIARLRKVYEALHTEFGDAISLELFGWNSPSGEGQAPSFALHHGFLSPAGVASLMAQTDIVVEPSEFQGFGLPGLEAMACGAVLVSTKCQGVEEYASPENAVVVPHDDLLGAVRRVIQDPGLRSRLRTAGRQTALRHDWTRITDDWEEYLTEALGKSLRPG